MLFFTQLSSLQTLMVIPATNVPSEKNSYLREEMNVRTLLISSIKLTTTTFSFFSKWQLAIILYLLANQFTESQRIRIL